MGVVGLVGLRVEPLSVDEVLAAVADPRAGGTVVFTGTVRDSDEGRAVTRLEYEAHPTVEQTLHEVVARVAADIPVCAIAAVHRVGSLQIGELAVVVAAAAPHRGQAFDACRRLIEDVKTTMPIWKHQVFTDGGDEWVNSP